MSTIYKPHDIISGEEQKKMQGFEWLRPRQISMKRQIVGFTQLNKENVSEEEINNLLANELADFRRISYGEVLDDRWVLNAASLVA